MNIPNMLTVFRLLLIPVFIMVFNSPAENRLLLAMGVFLLAGATDLLDGFIARRYNMITEIGTLMDPLADKLMLITVLLCMAYQQYFPPWIVAIVILKEAVMVGGGIYLYNAKKKIVIPANIYGKAATAGFYLAIVLLSISGGGIAGQIALYIAVALAVTAFLNYRHQALLELRKASKG